MSEGEQCSVKGCSRPGVAVIESHSFCREHFVSTCYERLETSTQRLRESRAEDASDESLRQFVADCVRKTTDIAQQTEDLDNLERARLLDVLLWASEVAIRLRRSRRRAATFPILLRCDKPGFSWEEEAETSRISRHGALVESKHGAEIGDSLLVRRRDTGKRALARVVWRQQRGAEHVEIGIEFLDCDNFWDLEWEGEEA
jgi:hypothetical protein